MFLPTTREELNHLGWDGLDVILVTGDSYIDSPFIGTAVIGKVLQNAGYRVGVIAQPDIHSDEDITRLGEPRLFWGVTGGSIDSMVANYTRSRRKESAMITPPVATTTADRTGPLLYMPTCYGATSRKRSLSCWEASRLVCGVSHITISGRIAYVPLYCLTPRPIIFFTVWRKRP